MSKEQSAIYMGERYGRHSFHVNMDDKSFSEAFKSARKLLGPGKAFVWRDLFYTTDYKEEIKNGEVPY